MIENIDCIAFKRDCGADPQGIVANTKLVNHRNVCAACTNLYQSMLALDSRLSAAFNLPVHEASIEEQLSAVQVLKQDNKGFAFRKPSLQQLKPIFAVAASVFVAVIGIFALQYPATTLANDVVKHIHHEPNLLILTQANTSPEKIKMVLKQANILIADDSLEILSAQLCPLDGQLAAHLIVRSETGQPVTVLILPENKTRGGKIKTNRFNGRILSAEHGVIAVVGGKKENLDHLESAVLSAFHWQD